MWRMKCLSSGITPPSNAAASSSSSGATKHAHRAAHCGFRVTVVLVAVAAGVAVAVAVRVAALPRHFVIIAAAEQALQPLQDARCGSALAPPMPLEPTQPLRRRHVRMSRTLWPPALAPGNDRLAHEKLPLMRPEGWLCHLWTTTAKTRWNGAKALRVLVSRLSSASSGGPAIWKAAVLWPGGAARPAVDTQ